MKNFYKIALAIIASLILVANTLATEMADFGDISDEEWVMTAPDRYPDAKVIILFDYGFAKRKDRTLYRHTRLKIFNKQGAEEACEIKIPIYEGDKIKDLKAHTILPGGQKQEVEEFFIKKVDQMEYKVFTFPSIQDNCIIEYQYLLERKRYGQPTWYFQNEYFTRRSVYAYDFGTPVYVNIPKNIRDRSGNFIELENLMPIGDEPLMGARRDNLMSVKFTGRWFLSWTDIGNAVDKWLRKKFKRGRRKIDELSKKICADQKNEDEKIAGLYAYISDSIVTDDDLEPVDRIAKIIDEGKGTSFEKSMLLVEMLKAQDISANGLFIGTRKEFGEIDTYAKSMHQFNRVLCLIRRDSLSYVLDPGARCAIFPYPEVNDLASQGLMIDSKVSRILEVPHRPRANGTDLASTIFIDENGDAVCSCTIIIKGYSIEPWREKELDSVPNIKMAEDLLDDIAVDYEVAEADLQQDFENDRYLFSLVLNLPKFVSIIDSSFFFSPFLIPIEENPLISDDRVFPIDFGFTYRNRHQVRVILPSNMQITDAPRNIYHQIPESKFIRKVLAEGNEIHVRLDLDVRREIYPAQAYEEIKGMFDIMSQSCADQVLATSVRDN